MSDGRKLSTLIEGWIKDSVLGDEYEVQRVQLVKESGIRILRVFAEKLKDGEYISMGTDDCEKLSRHISDKLDEEDPVSGSYYLEVSSPGLERQLFSDKDFLRFTGSDVEISLYRAMEGAKKIEGILLGRDEENIGIEDEKGERRFFPRSAVASVRLVVKF